MLNNQAGKNFCLSLLRGIACLDRYDWVRTIFGLTWYKRVLADISMKSSHTFLSIEKQAKAGWRSCSKSAPLLLKTLLIKESGRIVETPRHCFKNTLYKISSLNIKEISPFAPQYRPMCLWCKGKTRFCYCWWFFFLKKIV